MSNMTVVTRGSQITLTKEIREKTGITEGDRVTLNVVGSTIIISKKDPSVFRKLKRFLPDNFEAIFDNGGA